MDKAIDLYLIAANAGHEDARLIIKSMLQRNDKAIRDRKKIIINKYASILGEVKQVRVKRANVRDSPNLEGAIVARAEQGQLVLVLIEKGKWAQVALMDSGNIAWIYASLLEERVEVSVDSAEENVDQPGVGEVGSFEEDSDY